MNPVELGQGTFPLSEAATDRFAIMVNIGYLPPEEEAKLVHFDFKRVRLNPLMTKERIIQLRSAITEHVYMHERLAVYIQRLVAATRPYNPDTDWYTHSPSEYVEHGVDLGASPRAIICWGRLAKAGPCSSGAATRSPEDIQDPPHARPHLSAARGEPRPDHRHRDQGRHRASGHSVMALQISDCRSD
jgi:MoxR-like ATPase